MSHNDNFLFLNRDAIDNWKKELDSIPGRIEEKKTKITEFNKTLGGLESELGTLEKVKIAPVQSKIDGLEARIRVLTLPGVISSTDNEIDEHAKQVEILKVEHSQLQSTVAMADEEINKLEKLLQIKRYREEIDNFKSSMSTHESQVRILETRLTNENIEAEAVRDRMKSLQNELDINLRAEAEDRSSHNHNTVDNSYSSSQSSYTSSQGGYSSSKTPPPPKSSGYTSSATQNQHANEDRLRSEKIARLQGSIATLQHQLSDFSRQSSLTAQDLESHRRDLHNDRKSIENTERRLSSYTQYELSRADSSSTRALNSEVRAQNDTRSPIEIKRKQVQTELLDQQTKKIHAQKKLKDLKASLKSSILASDEFKSNDDMTDLQKQLTAQRTIMRPLQDEKGALEQCINENQQNVSNAKQSIDQMEVTRDKLRTNVFLQNYWNNPEILLQELKQAMMKGLEEYESSHPANQPLRVRIALAQLETRCKYILNQQNNPDAMVDAREKYEQLCGLLWEMSGYACDSALSDNIKAILRHTSAYSGHDKFHAIDQDEAMLKYKSFQKSHSENLELLDNDQLNQHEEDQYNKAYVTFNATLEQLGGASHHKAIAKLVDYGKAMLGAFDDHKEESRKKGNNEFDMKFHTAILHKATQWMRDPNNESLKTEFQNLAEHNAHGKSSTGKKVGGACMAFAGVVLAAVSVVVKVLSLGLAAPITFAGMGAGAALAVSGVGLFAFGMEKGERKKMSKFADAMDNAKGGPMYSTGLETVKCRG